MIRQNGATGAALLGLSLVAAAAGCKQRDTGSQVKDDAAPAATAPASTDGAALTVAWMHGSANCRENKDEKIQKYKMDDDTFILRENKCLTYEAPFIYLLFGGDRVLMLDSGAVPEASIEPMRDTVDGIITDWLAAKGQTSIQLIVAHTHGHGDHYMGDAQFTDRPNTTIVRTGQAAVKQFFGFSDWQGDAVTYELGGRTLQVMPIPGHMSDHIAVYDPKDSLLLTGDSLYPGHIFIADWTAYRASIGRLAAFAADKTVSYVLGAHVEAKSDGPDAEHRFYRYGETNQPEEHVLELFKSTLGELNQALIAAGEAPKDEYHNDFHIQPN